MTRLIRFHDRVQSQTAWARELCLTDQGLMYRLRHWPLEDALTTPAQKPRAGRMSLIAKAIERYLEDHPEEAKRYQEE